MKIRLSSQDGFTLTELIMTILVVGIAFLGFSITLCQQIKSTFYAQDFTVVSNLARSELEKMNNMNFAAIASSFIPTYEGYPYDLNRTVSFTQGTQGSAESLKKITVEFTKSGNTQVLFRASTYIAKNVTYGL